MNKKYARKMLAICPLNKPVYFHFEEDAYEEVLALIRMHKKEELQINNPDKIDLFLISDRKLVPDFVFAVTLSEAALKDENLLKVLRRVWWIDPDPQSRLPFSDKRKWLRVEVVRIINPELRKHNLFLSPEERFSGVIFTLVKKPEGKILTKLMIDAFSGIMVRDGSMLKYPLIQPRDVFYAVKKFM